MTTDNRDLYNVDVARFREVFSNFRQIGIGKDFCIVDMRFQARSGSVNLPFRFDGVMMVWCIEGHLKVSFNLMEYEIKPNSLFICVPGNVLKLNDIVGENEDLHYVCVAMSKEFASNQKIDVNKAFPKGLALIDDPSVRLTDPEASMLAVHLDLMGKMTESDMPYKSDCVLSLWSSMFYVLAGALDRRADMADSVNESTTRSRLLFQQFVNLVSQNYHMHRNVGFYADKLCLTPKYLSKLIKVATGRSAPEWIDAYVILEAKNLLKYSNDSIKEIVYKLNFPNQSVFYKFFKTRTGMTPSEYRNS